MLYKKQIHNQEFYHLQQKKKLQSFIIAIQIFVYAVSFINQCIIKIIMMMTIIISNNFISQFKSNYPFLYKKVCIKLTKLLLNENELINTMISL